MYVASSPDSVVQDITGPTHQNAERNFWHSSVEYSEEGSPKAARWWAEDWRAVRQLVDTEGSRLWDVSRFLQLGKNHTTCEQSQWQNISRNGTAITAMRPCCGAVS